MLSLEVYKGYPGEAELAGRIDNTAHDAAVAKVSEVVSYEKEIRLHLAEIIASNAFRGSRRCQQFLIHVVEHALTGDFDGLKERILGMHLFGRDASYDTNGDSIVRVTASDVRKRLLRFYKASAPSALRIELRSGSYIPEFHHVVDEFAYCPGQPAEESQRSRFEVVPPVPTPSPDAMRMEQVGPSVERSPARPHVPWMWWQHILMSGVLCLVFLLAGWKFGTLHATAPLRHDSPVDVRYAFYKELLGPIATDPQQQTRIVLSNPALFLYRGSASPTPPSNMDRGEKKTPVPRSVAHQLTDGADDPQADFPYHYLALDKTDYTGLGEAESAFDLEKLFTVLHRPSLLTEGRFLNWDEARDQNLILLGARHMMPWTQSTLTTANFRWEHNVIYNSHPRPGEQAVYTQTFDGRVLVDYGLIWMSQSPSGSRMLVLAGLTSTGTAGVGNFFIDPAQMQPVFQKLKAASPNGSIPPNWQVLVRITARDDVPLNASFVALRTTNQ
jgi:hypothetical protein